MRKAIPDDFRSDSMDVQTTESRLITIIQENIWIINTNP